jgi:Ca2+:H+ antiporter
MEVTRRDVIFLSIAGVLIAAAALAHFGDATPVLAFTVAAVAIAFLAHIVGGATEQLGSKVGSSVASVIQSGLGNLPELFISLFAIREGLIRVVQSALVGSIIANSVLVLGIAFIVGGARNGTQHFDSPRARMIATLCGAREVAQPDLRRCPARTLLPDVALFPRRR